MQEDGFNVNPYKKLVLGALSLLFSVWPLKIFCTDNSVDQQHPKNSGKSNTFVEGSRDGKEKPTPSGN